MLKRRKLKYQLLVSRISTDGVTLYFSVRRLHLFDSDKRLFTNWPFDHVIVAPTDESNAVLREYFFYPLSFSDIENILKTSESKREKTEEIKIKKADIDLIVREIEVRLSNESLLYVFCLVYSEFGAESIVWIKGKSPGCSCLLFRLILIINRYLKCRYFYFR